LKPARLQGIQEYPVRLLLTHTVNGLKASDRVLLLCWHLLLEEFGVTFEYLPEKKNVVADALSRLDDSLKIQEQEEEVLTLLSGSENNSISNIKLTITMHTALIFKEQAKVKGLREQGLAQPHYSIKHIDGYNENLLHPGQTRTEKSIRNTMTRSYLTQDVEH
jgi:hypothetical protein